jgi:hypothetical protein
LESWIISVFIAIIGVVSSVSVMKQKVNEGGSKDTEQDVRLKELEKFMNEKSPYLDHLSRFETAMKQKAESHTSKIVKLQQEMTQTPTMTEVRNEFISKELFKQMEKYINDKFVTVQRGIDKILEKLENK